jgi:hypothetical protein
MAMSTEPMEQLIEEAILGSSPSFSRPPWTSIQRLNLHDLVAAPTQPHQMTRGKQEGLIWWDAPPPHRRRPPLLPPEKGRHEEEEEDELNLAEKIQSPTHKLHKGKAQEDT